VAPTAQAFDRHSGVNETSRALYPFPSLVDLDKATQPQLSLPPHLARMLPLAAAGDRAATMVFLAEALKPKETGKNTSTAEMSPTGVWSERNPREATAQPGPTGYGIYSLMRVRFINRWRELRPLQRPGIRVAANVHMTHDGVGIARWPPPPTAPVATLATHRSPECQFRVCAVTRRRFPVGESPTRPSLQPEAPEQPRRYRTG
jgi:hypothetical protein